MPNATIKLGTTAVIVAVTRGVPRLLTVNTPNRVNGALSLPSGPLAVTGHSTLELALRGWVAEQTGIELGYVEQLYTFGDRFRDPHEAAGGRRSVTVAYLALVREVPVTSTGARWHDWYRCFPWEDWRKGEPELLGSTIQPALYRWADAAGDGEEVAARRERLDITFGLSGVPRNVNLVLERYELLYEANLVSERHRDRVERGLSKVTPPELALGDEMSLDHRRILAAAMGRLRGKILYRPVVFEMLKPSFRLLELQHVVEALAGVQLHKQNFRRLVDKGGLVDGTGVYDSPARGRPAELFRFRREVLRERPAPGVKLPRLATG